MFMEWVYTLTKNFYKWNVFYEYITVNNSISALDAILFPKLQRNCREGPSYHRTWWHGLYTVLPHTSDTCHLYFTEKVIILQADPSNLLKERTEVILKGRHRNFRIKFTGEKPSSVIYALFLWLLILEPWDTIIKKYIEWGFFINYMHLYIFRALVLLSLLVRK